MDQHIFLTGLRGAGKTTVLQSILAQFSGKIGGFSSKWGQNSLFLLHYGKEIVPNSLPVAGRFDGMRWSNPQRFDQQAKALFDTPLDLIVMDELGFFESEAHAFQQEVFKQLDGKTPVIGIIKPIHTDFLDKIRNHPNVKVFWVTEANRHQLPNELREEFPWLTAEFGQTKP